MDNCYFAGISNIGVFCKLTNSYCLVGLGTFDIIQNTIEEELNKVIPVVRCSIADTAIVGRISVGNRHGLLVPNLTTDQELQHLRNSLPDSVKIRRVDERLSALGNVILCNDHVAIVHADISKETEEALIDVLKVEVFRLNLGEHALVGSYAAVNSFGALVPAKTSIEIQRELASILQVPVIAGTVECGLETIGSNICVNDWFAIIGTKTTFAERNIVQSIFNINEKKANNISTNLKESLYESLL